MGMEIDKELCITCGEKPRVVMLQNFGRINMDGELLAYEEKVNYCANCYYKNQRKVIEAEWKLSGLCMGCGCELTSSKNLKNAECKDCRSRERHKENG